MRRWLGAFLFLALSLWTVHGLEVKLDQQEDNRERCAGMYSRSAWGGPVDPFILIKFKNDSMLPEQEDPIVSLVIFEYRDEDFIGIEIGNGNSNLRELICSPDLVTAGHCNETDVGEFILAPNATELSGNLILTQAVHLKSTAPINYPIVKTGYYCVATLDYPHTEPNPSVKYEAIVEFRNAYGELPATQIPKLPFYGGITVLYALVAVFWGFLYYQHRHDILPVQNYITAILVFLVVEMLLTWGFYDYLNAHGANIGSRVLLIVVAVLNAARNSFSFFLLLIVCMGYGVVKPTLGKTMLWVRGLAIAHFVFGLIYAVTSLLITPDAAGPFVLLIVLPLAGTLTAFYVWTLNSLNWTLKDLRERKQHSKEAMYKKLWWCILVSILVIFGFFFFNSFSFASASDPDYVPFHWKSRWFVLDGWLNLVYFADVAWVAYVWRPTANNRRFAMSDEIAQDDDGGFEIADIGAPDDSDDEDEEANIGSKGATTGSSNAPMERFNTRATSAAAASSSTPGATPASSASQPPPAVSSSAPQRRDIPRDSLDGETIFAVGEDGDKFSDDESDEDATLVRARK